MKNYTGNKRLQGLSQTIINHIPKHDYYFELFLGGGGIFRMLIEETPRVKEYFLNDLNLQCLVDMLGYLEGIEIKVVFNSHDATELIKDYLYVANSFFLLDPPYLHATRPSSTDIYGDYEMSDEDHEKFLLSVLQMVSPCMIIHPRCEMYDNHLKNWKQVDVKVRYNRKTSNECLYMNYDINKVSLHTYQYLGVDCWDRQRIKRKGDRLIAKINNLPELERAYILKQIGKHFFIDYRQK